MSWRELSKWTPWLDPLPVVMVSVFLTFLLCAVFAPPSMQIQNLVLGVSWWVPPLVGLSSLIFGLVWWLGLQFIEWKLQKILDTTRLPYIEVGMDGEPIERAEFVERRW